MGEPALPPAPRWKGRGARKAARSSPIGAALAQLRDSEHRIRALAVGSAALAHVDSQELRALGDAAFGRLAASTSCCGCSLASCPAREDCLLAARVCPHPQSAGTLGDGGQPAPSNGKGGTPQESHMHKGREHLGGQGYQAPQQSEELPRARDLQGVEPGPQQRVRDVEATSTTGSQGIAKDDSEESCCSAGAGAGSSQASAGGDTQSCDAPVVHYDVHLSLEEAFFLQHCIGGLDVLRPCVNAGACCSTDDRHGQEAIEEETAHDRKGRQSGATVEATQSDTCADPSSTPSASCQGPGASSKADPQGVPQDRGEAGMRLLSSNELWSIGIRAHPRFRETSVGFWHMRAKNWVLRGGAQYGADFAAYQQHPSLVHSSYLVLASRGHPLTPTSTSSSSSIPTSPLTSTSTAQAALQSLEAPRSSSSGADHRLQQWEDFQAVVRVAASVAKRVLFLQVVEVSETSSEARGEAALLHAGDTTRVSIPEVGTFEVLEIEVHRWLAERGREARDHDF